MTNATASVASSPARRATPLLIALAVAIAALWTSTATASAETLYYLDCDAAASGEVVKIKQIEEDGSSPGVAAVTDIVGCHAPSMTEGATGLAILDGYAYVAWSSSAGAGIGRVGVTAATRGSAWTRTHIAGPSGANTLLLGANPAGGYLYVYATDASPTNPRVLRVPAAGGSYEVLWQPTGVTRLNFGVVGDHVYYSTNTSPRVIRRSNLDGTGANEAFYTISAVIQAPPGVTPTLFAPTTDGATPFNRASMVTGDASRLIIYTFNADNNTTGGYSEATPASAPTQLRTWLYGTNAAPYQSTPYTSIGNQAWSGTHLYYALSGGPSPTTRKIVKVAADGTIVNNSLTTMITSGVNTYLAIATTSSPAAAATTHAVTIAKQGTGAGTVASSPAGIDCGATCSASFTSGASVTLTATAAAGSTFTSWGGACSGTAATCTLTVDAAKSATATFTAKPVTITGSAVTTARGVTRVRVRVPSAGSVRLIGTRSVRSRAGTATVCRTAKRVEKAGIVTLYCIPNRATRALLATRSVPVTLTVTYRSSAGTRVTDTVTATLPQREVAPPEPVTG